MRRRWLPRIANQPVLPPHPNSADAQSRPLIELQRVNKVYKTPSGDVTALRGVDLRVDRGEFVAVIGKSGSGKSTLINTITGIDRPTSGEVFVGGTPIHTLDESRLALWRGQSLGLIFQFFQLLPTLTLIENVMLPMELARRMPPRGRRAYAQDLLEQVGMADKADRLPVQVSAGQQQRVAIARALANEPDLLVADEPTGSLDAYTADSVFELFEGLVAQGKTVLMATHDRDLASRVSRVVLIANGEIMDQHIAQALPMLTHREMVELVSRLESITFRPGATIVRQGEPADRFYILLKGQVEVVLEHGGGETVIARLLGGEFFGEAGLLQGGARTATVRAALSSEVMVMALDRAMFNQMLGASEATREEIVRAMRIRLMHMEEHRALEVGDG